MDDAVGVRVIEGGEDLVYVFEAVAEIEGSLAQAVVQAGAFHQFHDHEHLIFHPEGRAEVGDVGVFEAGVNADLPQEPVGQIGVGAGIRKDDLHRLDAVGEQVADAEDFPHSAPAEEPNDFVVADSSANLKIHGPPLRI